MEQTSTSMDPHITGPIIGGFHQIGGKAKYNSIDIAYDESFPTELNLNKNMRTQTNTQQLKQDNHKLPKGIQQNCFVPAQTAMKFQPARVSNEMVIAPQHTTMSIIKQEIHQQNLMRSSTKSKSSKKNLLAVRNNPYLLELNKMGTIEQQGKKLQRKKSESLDFSYQNKQPPQKISKSLKPNVDRRPVNQNASFHQPPSNPPMQYQPP
jgi:hypothetical protein